MKKKKSFTSLRRASIFATRATFTVEGAAFGAPAEDSRVDFSGEELRRIEEKEKQIMQCSLTSARMQ
jgi:hypothetical protein